MKEEGPVTKTLYGRRGTPNRTSGGRLEIIRQDSNGSEALGEAQRRPNFHSLAMNLDRDVLRFKGPAFSSRFVRYDHSLGEGEGEGESNGAT